MYLSHDLKKETNIMNAYKRICHSCKRKDDLRNLSVINSLKYSSIGKEVQGYRVVEQVCECGNCIKRTTISDILDSKEQI